MPEIFFEILKMNASKFMHIRRVLLLILCCFIVLLIIVSLIFSANKNAENFKRVSLVSPSAEVVIGHFLELAIHNSSWYGDDNRIFDIISAKYDGLSDADDDYISLKEKSPDFAEYIYRRNGLPNPTASYKWTTPVTIGLDWQRISIPIANGDVKNIVPFGLAASDRARPENYPVFQDQILKSIADIRTETGLDISFFDPSDPREYTKNHAKIRVVPMVNPQSWRERKRGGKTYTVSSIEDELVTAVRLTTDETQGMDAFLIPNANNSIGYAACKIDPLLPEIRVRELISECLVSAMGLPNFISATIPDQYIDERISFLSILYCSVIKPGMNRYELIRALKSNEICLSKFYNK